MQTERFPDPVPSFGCTSVVFLVAEGDYWLEVDARGAVFLLDFEKTWSAVVRFAVAEA